MYREELQALFDKQLDKLFKLIDNQLDHLKENFPHEEVVSLQQPCFEVAY